MLFVKKHTICLCIVFLFFISSSPFVFSQIQQYKEYTIHKGDTLWDISAETLNDPFLWPKIWKENPEIKNPDLIYPTEKIRIPLYILQKEVTEQPKLKRKPMPIPERRTEIKMPALKEQPVSSKMEPAPQPEYLIDKNLLIMSGYITDTVRSVGVLYDTPAETSLLTQGNYAYIQTDNPVKKGEKFYIIYPAEEVEHPIYGGHLGTRIAILGTAEVVDEKDPKVIITESHSEIPIGSLLDTYYAIEPPLMVKNPREPFARGHIVTSLKRVTSYGTLDVVFIDRGSNDGLAVGDMLATTLKNDHHTIRNGVIQIISVRPKTSAAIIRKLTQEIHKGDPVVGIMPE